MNFKTLALTLLLGAQSHAAGIGAGGTIEGGATIQFPDISFPPLAVPTFDPITLPGYTFSAITIPAFTWPPIVIPVETAVPK